MIRILENRKRNNWFLLLYVMQVKDNLVNSISNPTKKKQHFDNIAGTRKLLTVKH